METFRSGNDSNGQEDDFPSCLCNNGAYSMEAIIARSWTTHTLTTGEDTIVDDMIAIVSAIPSSIITYISVHCDLFPTSIRTITYIAAIAIGSTIALHFEALRLPVRSRKI